MQYLKVTVLLFEEISVVHINMSTSIIFPVNEVAVMDKLAGIMGCGIGSFPPIYLGLPLGAKYKAAEVWNEVIKKVEKKLAIWQMQYLSMECRFVLIYNVLDNIRILIK